ncbi:MAG: NAD-dependent epimerase/dehydratase family protein [Bacteroidetes bacterium]|nr:NAD-dependent epimerase/dehydratase family protein [Bacteroidota bacterium]
MILVTGATGFLGSYLTKLLLQKGGKVRTLKRPTSDLSLLGEFAQQIEWIEGNVLDISSLQLAMKDVEKVYHCAAIISFIPSETDYMMQVNIEGTANVMDVARDTGVKKVVHVSSIAAFGVAPAGKIMDENFSDPNISKCFAYYRSKQYGEREAWRAEAEGMNVVIACPATILGAGWWEEEPNSLFKTVYEGLKFYVASNMGFVDVRDVAECLYRLMEGNFSGEKFILSAENLSFREIIGQMADEMKVKRPSLEAGRFLLSLAWRAEVLKSFFTGSRPVVTRDSAGIAFESFSYSNEKIKAALNYEFLPVRETIAETARVFLKSIKEGKDYGTFT